jgi:hypothetical protein
VFNHKVYIKKKVGVNRHSDTLQVMKYIKNAEVAHMAEKKHDVNKKRAAVIDLIGIICVIIGGAIAVLHTPLRGSGLGTIFMVIGVILLFIALSKFKHAE